MLDNPRPVREVALQERTEIADAGVVDQYVGCADNLVHGIGQRLHGGFVADVDRVGSARDAERFDLALNCLQCGLVDIGSDDVRALTCERQCSRTADARSGAGDEHLLLFQIGNGHQCR